MIDLALLHSLREIGIALIGAGNIAFLLWLKLRSERSSAERSEREGPQDFADHLQQKHTQDWEFPPRWVPPTSEYIAKERVR